MTPVSTLIVLDGLSSLTPIEVHVFRHEFIGMFRLSSTRSVHPSELRVLDTLRSPPSSPPCSPIGPNPFAGSQESRYNSLEDDVESEVRYEEGDGTAFLAKSAITRLQKMMTPPAVRYNSGSGYGYGGGLRRSATAGSSVRYSRQMHTGMSIRR